MDVTGNWGVSEEGRRKKGEIEAEIPSFLHFFLIPISKRKRERHTQRKRA